MRKYTEATSLLFGGIKWNKIDKIEMVLWAESESDQREKKPAHKEGPPIWKRRITVIMLWAIVNDGDSA